MNRERAHVELDFRPSLELVSSVRRFVTSVYEQLLSSPHEASRIGVATHELLENAVRCSSDGTVNIRIEVEVGSQPAVLITTKNQARAEDIQSLVGLVDAMNAAPDPMLHYTGLMRANAKRPVGSGLGLARVRAECDLRIDLAIDGDLVTVTGRGVVGEEP